MKAFFKDPAGGFSSYRLVFITWTVGPFIVWAIHCFMHPDEPVITVEIVGVILTVAFGKTHQKKFEVKKNGEESTDGDKP